MLAAAALLVISCGRNGRVIPAHKLSEIYAEMLVLDPADQEQSSVGIDG